MNIKKIKDVVNMDIPDDIKENYILSVLADDDDVIPKILKILEYERERNKELISDFNVELSRAMVVLNDNSLKYGKDVIAEPKWVVGEIKKHFIKWKDYVSSGFII